MESQKVEFIFGGDKPWDPADWTTSDDRVRGGKSQSHLHCKPSEPVARFYGNLDISTLGGAGFASQRTTGDDRVWDLSGFAGVVVDVAEADSKKYTLTLKDELLAPDPDTGREQATLSYEYDFVIEKEEQGGKKVFMPWSEFKATYRGKEKEDARALDVKTVRRFSLLMRRDDARSGFSARTFVYPYKESVGACSESKLSQERVHGVRTGNSDPKNISAASSSDHDARIRYISASSLSTTHITLLLLATPRRRANLLSIAAVPRPPPSLPHPSLLRSFPPAGWRASHPAFSTPTLSGAVSQALYKSRHPLSSAMDKDGADVESGRGPKSVSHFKIVFDQGLVTPEVLKWHYDGAGTEEDPYVVQWIDGDPRNPMFFPMWKKWSLTILVAFATLAVAFVSSAYSGGINEMMTQFNIGEEVATLGLSLFVLGFAIGPLLWAPMSEMFGRQVLFVGTYALLTFFNAGAAGSQNAQTLIILRFFAGAFGSSPLTNAGGVIADMFPASQRGLAMSVFAAAPFLGPTLGPIIGGFVGETIGWRWVEGIMAIFTGVLWIIGSLLIPETYSPVLLRKRAARLSKMTGKVYVSKGDIDHPPASLGQAFKTALSRPWILLFREPIVLLLSIYMAIIYGTLYMMFAAFPIVYQQGRGWSPGIGGLAFIGVAVGMIAAVIYTIPDNKRYIKAGEKDPDGIAPPETRLPPAMIGGIAIPIGLFWFAWTNGPNIHWIVSIIASAPFGFGMVLVFLSIMNYLIDAYTIFAASVLAANAVLRSLFGTAFPLFTTYMYNSLGIHWASSIPAFLALACVPFPFLFYKYGPAIRARCKFAAESAEFMRSIRQQASGAEHDDDGTSDASRRVEQEEEIKEQEAFDYSYDTESPAAQRRSSERPRFERIKTRRDNDAAKEWENSNPYDIDRVNTKDSFGRTRSRPGSVKEKSRPGSGLSRPNSRLSKN